MRTDFLNLFAKLSRRFHLEQSAYLVCRHLPLLPLSLDGAPEDHLRRLRPDSACSCLEEHAVPVNPAYDLQIIVAVYNAEAWLDTCIQSVLQQQTQYTYCLTLVNDGSTDRSLQIMHKYASYPYIQILDQPNGGPGSARNLALRQMQGRFVTFLDADDALTPDAVDTWLAAAERNDADIVEAGVMRWDGKRVLSPAYSRDEVGEQLLLSGKAASRIYRNTCWQHVAFPEHYWAEDNVNWMLVYHQAPYRMVSLSHGVYLYRDTPGSQSTGQLTNPRRIDTYWGTRAMLAAARQLNLPFSTFYLEAFLRQTSLNMHRIAILGDRRLNRAFFLATRELLLTYFPDQTSSSTKEHHLEMALRRGDFRDFYTFSLFLF